jgi:hypothetical protein
MIKFDNELQQVSSFLRFPMQIFFRSDSFSKLPDQMSDKLSWIFDMSDVVLSTPHLSRI